MPNYKQHVLHLLIINYVFGISLNVENNFVMIFKEHQNKNVLFIIVHSKIHLFMELNVQQKRNVQNFLQKIYALKVLMVFVNGLIIIVISIQVVILLLVHMIKFVNLYQKIVQQMEISV